MMKETVKIWIDLSKSDLNSSRLLYENGNLRNSYFLFQQATEKANKAFALLLGILREEEFKTIQHDQLKIYRKAIVKQESKIENLIKILEPFPELTNHKILGKIDFTNYHKLLKEGTNSIDNLREYDLVNIPIKDLNILLKKLKEVKKIEIKLPNDYKNIFHKHIFEVADWIGKFETKKAYKVKSECIRLINNKKKAKQFYDLIIKQIFPFIIKITFINLTLYYCAIITIQHSSLTRYPENNTSPEQIYTKRLPLVKKQIDFMDLLENAINELDKINIT